MEQWRSVAGYGNRYQVSDLGRVRSVQRGKVLSLVKNRRGYLQVNLYREGRVRNFLVHRLVAAAFLGEIPLGWQVNHRNGVKTDNRVANLEVVTGVQNRRHARDLGLVKPRRGENNLRAKLTGGQVRAIRELRSEGVTAREVATRFGVTERTVYRIAHRRAWTHLP